MLDCLELELMQLFIMISKEEFIELIKDVQDLDKEFDKWQELRVNMFETYLGDIASRLAYKTYKYLFNDEGVDTISWWLYERDCNWDDNKMFDSEGNEIPTETIEDLWNIVKNDRL